MSIVGIVCAKDTSSRFPGKNKYIHKGVPLFWHSVCALLESNYVDDVYVATDSPDIMKYCEGRGVGIIYRGVNANYTDEPLIDVLSYCLKSIDKRYDAVVTIMANCPNHTAHNVNEAITKYRTNSELKEVRGFDKNGFETGLLLFDSEVVMESRQISSHIGATLTEGYEVHYEADLRD